jgi:hypothetical protein
MKEPPIQFQTNAEGTTHEWKSASKWPLPEAARRSLFFQAGPSGSVSSMNDGRLALDSPRKESGADPYTVDASTTSGKKTRWTNTVGGEFAYPDMTANDIKGLTYTTETITEDLNVTGHPILHLWIDSTAADGDFIAFLEEIDSKGFSRYVSEGCLRASHRALSRPPYDNLGLPYHRSARKDAAPLVPGKPSELVFDLLPISNIFNTGNRLRVTIVCADKDNLETPVVNPAPRVTVFRNIKYASRLDLPVVPSKKTRTPG